jgi:hypothetical protein
VRTFAGVTLVLAALAAFSAHEARGQARLSFSVSVSPLFAGVGFGIGGGYYAPGRYDRGRRSSYSCWDYYWDSYWDPYSDWFYDCVAYSPWRYNSFRTRSWLSQRAGYYGSHNAFVYIRDPFASRWRYWDYDPWSGYWGGGYWDGYYGGVPTTYARAGRTTVMVNHRSPGIGAASRHEESPRTATGRTAVRRRGTTTTAADPARTPAGSGADTGRRVRPSSVPAAGRTGGRIALPGGRTPARAGDLSTRARPSSSALPSSRLPSRNPATARPTGARTRSPWVSSGANRPGTRATPRTTPSTRRAAARTPATRSAPSRSSRTGSAPSRAPRTRSAPSREHSVRSAPSPAPRASSAPSRTPITRPAPSRAPSTHSTPRAQAKPPARSPRGSSSRPARRRRGG